MHTHSTTLGYLLALLHIPVSYLSNQLYVDQSLVSKWKNGKRILSPHSIHYNSVVKLLAEEGRKRNATALQDLFTSLYPEKNVSNLDYLETCIAEFLTHHTYSALKTMPLHTSTLSQGSLNLNFSVFNDISGRRHAVFNFLDYLDQLDAPIDCYIIDVSYQDWLLEDECYFNNWMHRMQTLLKAGHRIHFIRGLSYSSPYLYEFLRKTYVLLSYSNFMTYYCANTSLDGYMYVNYMIPSQLSLLGLNQFSDSGKMYTAIFQDEFTLAQHHEMYLKLLKRAQLVKQGTSLAFIQELKKDFNMRYSPISKTLLSSLAPTFITMSKSLLTEILDTYKIQDGLKEKCFIFYDMLQVLLPNSHHFYNLNTIEQYAYLPSIPCHFLSTLLGKHITMTQQQYKKHLLSLISLLENNPECHLSFVNHCYEQPLVYNFAIYHTNHFYINLASPVDGILKYSYDPLILHCCDILFPSASTDDFLSYKSSHNLEALKQIVRLC